jgi:energy-coupling factor transport system ATP-binding protein
LNQDLGLTVILSEHRLERVVQYVDRILYLPGVGEPPILGDPRTVLAQVEITPPLVTLAKALGWSPLPLTIKEGRRFARRADAQVWRHPGRHAARSRTASGRRLSISVEGLGFSYNGHPALHGHSRWRCAGRVRGPDGAQRVGQDDPAQAVGGACSSLTRGRVRLLGSSDASGRLMDTRRAAVDEIIRVVGYVPQNPNALLFGDTVRQELDFTRRGHGLPPKGPCPAVRLSLAAYADRYPRDLSVGERQRVALASILVAEPQILLLDEPTRGLDYQQKEALAGFLKRKRRGGGRSSWPLTTWSWQRAVPTG